MLIEMFTKKDFNETDPLPELCELKGIRWNSYGFTILYTNHSRHDYIMPMDKENYLKLEKMLKAAYQKKAKLIELAGDVYRVPRDGHAMCKDKSSDWAVKIIE